MSRLIAAPVARLLGWRGLHLLWPGLVAVVVAVLVMRPWELASGAPLVYWGDALAVSAHFKTVGEQGWYEFQPRLGAPFGQNYHDFPTADNLHMVAALVLSWVTPSWGAAVNTYFFLGFALAAITAAWLFRVVGLAPAVGGVLAVLYALAPVHFMRGVAHLWLSSYYAVPLGILLILLVARGEQLWGWSAKRSLARYVVSPTARTVAITGLIAASSTYYGVFFLVILASVAVLTWLVNRSWRHLWHAAAVGAVTVAWLLLNMLPDILYAREHGANPDGLERSRGEAEVYALKFVQMILPSNFHRVDALASARREYDSHYIVLGEPSALGVIAAFGFVASFVVVLMVALARTRTGVDGRAQAGFGPGADLRALSVMTVVAFMFSTIGGISTLISFVTPNLRGWNRMTVFIAATALAITGLIMQAVWARLKARLQERDRPTSTWALRGAATAGILGLLGIGIFDQTPAIASGAYAQTNADYESDKAYFGAIEASLPREAEVFVVPSLAFPETTSPSGWYASQQLIPYLQTSQIHWTVGGIKGRPEADWPRVATQYGDGSLGLLAAAAGMHGILVDRAGYLDRGVAVEAALATTTQVEPVVDSAGRYAYYSLEQVRARLDKELSASEREDLAFDVLDPVAAYLVDGTTPYWVDDADATLPLGGALQVELVNAGEEPRTVHVTFSAVSEAAEVDILVTGCSLSTTVDTDTELKPVAISMSVPAEGCSFTLAPSAAAAVSITVPTVQDDAVLETLATLGQGGSPNAPAARR